MNTPAWIIGLFFCWLPPAFTQRPVINPGGVVNAASLAGADQPASAIVPGAIASIFGQNLASETQTADTLPLPATLGGTSVTVDGFAARLFYVSPTQINFQVPSELSFDRTLTHRVLVSTTASTSETVQVNVAGDAAGIFTQEARGCGRGVILNLGADGSNPTLNGPTQSASPGSYVAIFATGLGPVLFRPPDGEPAPRNPLARTLSGGDVLLGPPGFAKHIFPVTYSGRAPGLVGVDQVNVRIPEDAPEGCAVPLTIEGLSRSSQPVTLSIRRVGAQCFDVQPRRFGTLRWQRTVTSGPQPSASTTQETFTASFAEAPANQVTPLRPPGPPEGSCTCGQFQVGDPWDPKPGPQCPGTGIRTLRVGALTLDGVPASPIMVNPSISLGEVTYTATLSTNSIKATSVRVLAAGGPEVGAFETGLSLPPPIEVTTPLPPGTAIPARQPFRVAWTGGRQDASVRVTLISRTAPLAQYFCECNAVADSGSVTFELTRPLPDRPPALGVAGGDDVRVIVRVAPRPDRVPTFFAPGFTHEGTHEWSYEYRYTGLSIRAQ
ncbi:MAG: hypothetical protein ACRD8O_10370 [Bryobacteraceae bacterium]